ncbi:putative beta-tubulin cofactor d [Neospora caninum Liverpool]|uniref:Beta-tubulin cofactor d, putative n=1 Tax=Neospora caninum (strain Liverpool) TaxID=572307 RepID=F0V8X9_NEOCL|nr:putative beta-tubulin cofactor d [Neospora caninum Liverpool]CBZ50170.1 putative beta-tubulin cofactor d [Neospora caninum Liverpool]CEL64767.1 TPA: beta-tubulin cofactor d, putative [Neospora caninum Liverpool]|eukprot:XP_003880205.1 putative beta-tubulin cofactor d [Neospora caninum Liverpool]
MDAISVSKRQDGPSAAGSASGRTGGLRQHAPSRPALLSESEQPDGTQFADSSLTNDGVCGNLDYFREAETFFGDLARLTQVSVSLCEAVDSLRRLEPAASEVYVHPATVHRVEEAVELVASCVRVLDRYQNQPTLLDRHLPQIVDPIGRVVEKYLNLISPVSPDTSASSAPTVHSPRESLSLSFSSPTRSAPASLGCPTARVGHQEALQRSTNGEHEEEQVRRLAASLSLRLLLHLVYALCKVRGYKSIQLLLPQRSDLLESVVDLCEFLFEAELLSSASSSWFSAAAETENPVSPRCVGSGTHGEHALRAELCDRDKDERERTNAGNFSLETARTESEGTGTRRDQCRTALRELAALARQLPLWSTHYSLLVWLSLLVLAPFGLDSLDSSLQAAKERKHVAGVDGEEKSQPKTLGLRIVLLTEAYLRTTNTKASDAAAFALARFFSRPDVAVKAPELLPHFLNFCQHSLFSERQQATSGEACASSLSASPGACLSCPRNRATERGGEGDSQLAQVPSCVSAGPNKEAAPVPLFQRANALRALNEILKIIDRRAVLPQVPRLRTLLGLASSASEGQLEHGAWSEGDARQLWSSLASLSALFRKLRCSCAARLCMLLLPPVDTRSLLWRYTPHARCLTTLLQQKQPQAKTADETEATRETTGDECGELEKCEGSAALDPRLDGGDEQDEDVPEEVEEVIDLLLERLSDRDSAVRWTASKSIARVVMQLPKEFADQVVVTVLDSLTSVPLSASLASKRLWHGSCLALAELLRRGLVFLSRLAACCSCLRLALAVEASASCGTGDTTGAAAGTALRDAACYAAWSLARSYYRTEALKTEVQSLSRSLLLAALFDREVNCRRAAAAAFQELEGRQGGIACGLTIITIADFFALATRRSSYLRAAPQVASLSQDYALLLLRALSTLLLSPHADEELRVLGAASLKRIAVQYPKLAAEEVLATVLTKAAAPDEDFGTRHGALLGLTALTEALCGKKKCRGADRRPHGGVHAPAGEESEQWEGVPEKTQTEIRQVVLKVEKQRQYRGKGGDLIRVAVCKLIHGLASSPSITFKLATARRYLATLLEGLRHFSESVQLAAAEALRALLLLRMPVEEVCEFMVPTLVAHLNNPDEHVAARRGYVLAFATLPPAVYRRCLLAGRAVASTSATAERASEPDEATSGSAGPGGSSEGGRGSDENAPDVFALLCREATSRAPCGQAALGDAQTRRNALIALGSALAVLLPSSETGTSSSAQPEPARAEKDPATRGRTAVVSSMEPAGSGAEPASDTQLASEAETPRGSPGSFSWRAVVETLEACCADFQADQRGDVGSWVREVAAEIACFLLENAGQSAGDPENGIPRSEPNSSTPHADRFVPDAETAETLAGTEHESSRAESGRREGCRALRREESLRLLTLLTRMAMENLDRTRSRATFLLYHMTAPLFRRTEKRAMGRAELAVSPFRIEWIWGRVFHDYSYELGPADVLPIDVLGSPGSCDAAPAPCLLALAPKPAQSPPYVSLLQQCLLPVALRQKREFEETRPELPFQRLNLSDLATLGTAPTERPASGIDASFHGAGSPPGTGEETGQADEAFPTTSESFDFLLELSVMDGGCATLHKTRKAGVLLRLPLFTKPEVTFPRLLPLLLLPPYRRRTAEGVCLGLGAAMGSTADKTAEAFLSFLVELRRLGASSKQHVTASPEKAPATGQIEATSDRSRLYQQFVTQTQEAGKDAQHARTAPNATVTRALVDVLAQCAAELKTGGSEYLDKLTLAALRTISTVLSNETVTPDDVSRVLKILTKGPLAKGAWLRSFQLVKSRCEAFVALAGATTTQNTSAAEGEEAPNVLKEKRDALCHALTFLLHRFPKIRLLAAESLYSSLLLSLSPEPDCPGGVEASTFVRESSSSSGSESQDTARPSSEQLLVLSETQLDEATELLTVTPWLEVNVTEVDTRACSPSNLSSGQAESSSVEEKGTDTGTSDPTPTGAERENDDCPVERLVVLFSVQKQWNTLFPNRPIPSRKKRELSLLRCD